MKTWMDDVGPDHHAEWEAEVRRRDAEQDRLAKAELHDRWMADYDRGVAEGVASRERGEQRRCPYNEEGSALREGWLDGWDH